MIWHDLASFHCFGLFRSVVINLSVIVSVWDYRRLLQLARCLGGLGLVWVIKGMIMRCLCIT